LDAQVAQQRCLNKERHPHKSEVVLAQDAACSVAVDD
jgi:hypothetical protein